MPGCSRAKNPRGIEIKFTEEDHKYISILKGKEINYISGTTFIDNFFPKFDPEGKITERCAKREGISVLEMKQRWKDKADKSCIYGTKIHECMEDNLLRRPLRNIPSDDREKLVFEVAKKLSSKILDKAEILGIEKIIFDENLKIAGTIDLLIRSKKNGSIWILDHKTNERIETENRYHSFALPPIENSPNTNYSHYTYQLNLYQYILKNVGYVDKNEKINMMLFHITEKGSKNYILENKQEDIEKMIQYYQTNGLREKNI